MQIKSKKGQSGSLVAVMGGIASIAVILGIVAIVAGIGGQVTQTQLDDQEADSVVECTNVGANCSLAYNLSRRGAESQVNFSDNYTTMGTIAGAGILILLVLGGFAFFLRGRMGA